MLHHHLKNLWEFEVSSLCIIHRGRNKLRISRATWAPLQLKDWGPWIFSMCQIWFLWYLLNDRRWNKPTFSKAIWALGLYILCALIKFWGQLAWGVRLIVHPNIHSGTPRSPTYHIVKTAWHDATRAYSNNPNTCPWRSIFPTRLQQENADDLYMYNKNSTHVLFIMTQHYPINICCIKYVSWLHYLDPWV